MSRIRFYCDQETFDRFKESLSSASRFVSTGTICHDPNNEIRHPPMLLVPIEGQPLVEWPTLEANEP